MYVLHYHYAIHYGHGACTHAQVDHQLTYRYIKGDSLPSRNALLSKDTVSQDYNLERTGQSLHKDTHTHTRSTHAYNTCTCTYLGFYDFRHY